MNNNLSENIDRENLPLKAKKSDKPLDIIIAILVVLLIAVVISMFFFERILVKQTSMTPTIIDGQTVVVKKTQNISRGDIIVFDDDNVSERLLIKRVIGIGGDTLSIDEEGNLHITYVNDVGETVHTVKTEGYINNGDNIVIPETIVPYGMLYVLGDNRLISHDSSEFGCVLKDSVIGKVVLIYG